ncbi:hypothetical protein Lalb_Chr21g0316031 [Lupinus albus]|uniref:Uncharacterized protein n=1 Tax=Lupinus albus TaxID=3870 RepID=A0A6A4NUA7_LUPAL|nr:hypothetical protein Lalb_Chr21g0316031 [Lupinus albus]
MSELLLFFANGDILIYWDTQACKVLMSIAPCDVADSMQPEPCNLELLCLESLGKSLQ